MESSYNFLKSLRVSILSDPGSHKVPGDSRETHIFQMKTNYCHWRRNLTLDSFDPTFWYFIVNPNQINWGGVFAYDRKTLGDTQAKATRGNHCSQYVLTVNKMVGTKYSNVQYKSGISLQGNI
jgi:hypothetical protein